MVRNLTDPDGDGTLEWQERVVDVDGDSLSIDLILDQVDGSNAADSNPSWLDYTPTTNTINTDEIEVLVDITADTSGLSAGSTYTFEITADDGITTTTRTFTLEVTQPPVYDGSKIFVADYTNGTIIQAPLTTNYDVTTIGSESSFSQSETGKLRGATFSPDGTKMYTVGQSNNKIYEYTLGTAWDVTTANYNSASKNLTANPGVPLGILMRPNGKDIYVYDNDDATGQYTLNTAYDLGSGTASEATYNPSGSEQIVDFSPDGKIAYTDFAVAYSVGTAWDITTIDDSSRLQDGSADLNYNLSEAFMANDGSKYISIDGGNNDVVEHTLGTSYDVSTIQDTNRHTLTSGGNHQTLWFGK